MKKINIELLLRPNIKALVPYSSARDEYSGANAVFLDANENPFDSGINRYPDPFQRELKAVISEIKKVSAANIFLGNGSDEPIDLLFRAFCNPGMDNVISMKPTYGMYKVCADINQVEYRESLLNIDFQLNTTDLLQKADEHTKLIFLCSPNNPTANLLNKADILKLLQAFNGIVVLDEAYIDFSSKQSLLSELENFQNLVILQTFSKAWGMAGIRLGIAFASPEIIGVFNKIKYPYNINILTQREALRLLLRTDRKDIEVGEILEQRRVLTSELEKFAMVEKVMPSETNFLMVKVQKPREIYNYLVDNFIIVRDRSKVALCEGCLRFTVGTADENKKLLNALLQYQNNK